ncbi:MAG: heme NO-binding domain-containing protein [Clostridium sp.]|uniref:heme NO-binding domain-containing protein n=1 Tax=Clostridium sp. TaxID=1506 RepID=UPI0029127030|nr:heme NO-binding domain-containing protein [Clostridium sp.]MDU5108928.1 heme NO-binding domain-containing protein [Clostridium sp.]
MKGTVVSTWIRTCRDLYGNEQIRKSLKAVNWPEDIVFSPLDDVEDEKIFKFIGVIADNVGTPINELWRIIGENNLNKFAEDYPVFFKRVDLYKFLNSLNFVHAIIMKKIRGAKPPIMAIKQMSENGINLTYRSDRELFDYFLGLLWGSVKFFGEKVKIEEVGREKGELTVYIEFEKNIHFKKKYFISRTLSNFGFKSLELKIGVPIFILVTLVGLPMVGLVKGALMGGIAGLISVFVSSIIVKPLNDIIENIENNNFDAIDTSISTNDELERIYTGISKLKNSISEDLTSANLTLNELSVFTQSMFKTTENMKKATQEISTSSEQVLELAERQEVSTEELVNQTNENIEALKDLVVLQDKNKNILDKSVDKIKESYLNVDKSNEAIRETLSSFMSVKERGQSLQRKADDITNIVSLVSGISDQTNLLALNASIEAARAGEQGRGFAVVAEEVRKLAEQSQQAVKDINNNLSYFANEINSLVSSIEKQYTFLEVEASNLEKVRTVSSEANDLIRVVSNETNEAINKLNKEVTSVSDMSKNIDLLAAIAAENAASSQLVNQNVEEFTRSIQEMLITLGKVRDVGENFVTDVD